MGKKFLIMIVLVFVIFSTVFPLFASAEGFITDTNDKIAANGSAQIGTVSAKVWTSVRLILQVAALTAFLWAGIRYMLASADQKADLKKSLIMIIIGAVIVFGTTIVIDFVTTAAGQAMGP